MIVRVKLMASLRSKLPAGATGGTAQLEVEPDTTVAGVLDRLGIAGIGEAVEISNQRVRVVGLTHGVKSLSGPYVFCSLTTARPLLPRLQRGQATYVLARCRNAADAPAVVQRLREHYSSLSAFTSAEFSLRSRLHWLIKTKAGIAMGCAAVLGLLVGAVVTSQTLYAATAASLKEYAVLRALGIPRWRMVATVLAQSFWVGLIGLALTVPIVLVLVEVAGFLEAKVLLPGWLMGVAAAVTMFMALISGLAALRSLRGVDPATLLR
jgi:putative ABC transport system permease protein